MYMGVLGDLNMFYCIEFSELTLKELCRRKIRKLVRKENRDRLGLPTAMVNYLNQY